MEDRRSGLRDRRSAWHPRTRWLPWIPTVAIAVDVSTPSEPAIESSTPEAVRQLPLRLVAPPVAEASRSLTVLLIDDNHHHRIPLLRALRAEGYDMLHAADGARGEELFRTSLREIDALIACAQMQRMSGFDLARRVRSTRPEIAVLLMCRSFSSAERADRSFERGFPVIDEPFTPDQLTRRLAEILAASRSRDCPESQ